MGTTTLIQKLRLQPGQRALILNPPADYLERLGTLPAGVELVSEPGGAFDFVQLFARNRTELERLVPQALAAVKFDGVLWIAYPKRSAKVETDITRDVGWDTVMATGLRPVTQIAIDEVWSAVRFRPASQVGR